MKKKNRICYVIDFALLLLFLVFPFFGGTLRITIMGRIMCMIILAFSLDLLWGYGGLINMGQGVFFGLGGYIAAISLVSREGVPMYMKNLGIAELPPLVKFLGNNAVYGIAALVLPALTAGIIGWFIFSSKIKGMFFSLITMAMVEIFELLIRAGQTLTGGYNGIGGIPKLWFSGNSLNLKQMYYLVLVCTVLVYFVCRFITNSRFGRVTKAIKNNEQRVDFLGYRSSMYKVVLFMISGMLAGLAGALYAPMNGMVSVSDVGMAFSTTMIIWLAIGGRGNLTGAAVGCLLVNMGKSVLSERFTDKWQFFLGLLLVVLVFLMPEGVVGRILKVGGRIGSREKSGKITKKEETANG